MRRFVDASRHTELLASALEDPEDQPFVRFRRLFHSWQLATARGMSDEDYVACVRSLDERVAELDGHGFRTTPLQVQDALAHALHRPENSLLVKDETQNVSGSHKARHLMQVGIWLEITERLGLTAKDDTPPLAIASCGNAALAAAVVARAMRRRLLVFVPPDAEASVLERMRELEAEIQVCPREESRVGDPCMHAFHDAVHEGALPFGCQGPENGLTIEGGLTLGYEIVGQLRTLRRGVKQLVVQVGGGALASGIFQAFFEANTSRLLGNQLPRLHTVQTEGGHPLQRAHAKLLERVEAAEREDAGVRREDVLEQQLHSAAHRREEYMWPWVPTPQSYASGILDDETYDWLALVDGMLRSRGSAVVARERTLREAHDLARSTTGIEVCATGASGVAGLMTLQMDSSIDPASRALLLFTGARR